MLLLFRECGRLKEFPAVEKSQTGDADIMESILHDRRHYRGEAAAAGRPGKAWVLACGLDDGESRSSTPPISNFEIIDEDFFLPFFASI